MRHADAGYHEALDAAREGGLDLPSVRSGAISRHEQPPRIVTDLLIRDLAQVATPGGDAGPLRGRRSATCASSRTRSSSAATVSIEAVGPMRDLPADVGSPEEIDGRGLAAIPGLVDCHTHACFGGDRVNEFSLRAGGASYEELHAAGGGILSTVRATRAAGEDELTAITLRHRSWMRAHGTTTFEAKSGYGLDHDTELAQLRAIRAAGGVPTWLGAHTVPPEFERRRRLPRLPPRRGAARGGPARRGRRRLPRAGLVRRRPGASLSGGLPRRRPRAAAARRPVHRVGCDRPRDRARCPLGRPPRGDRAGRCRSSSPRATSPACSCRRARSSSRDRCRRPVRSPTQEHWSRWRPTSTPAAPSATACRSSSRSPARR